MQRHSYVKVYSRSLKLPPWVRKPVSSTPVCKQPLGRGEHKEVIGHSRHWNVKFPHTYLNSKFATLPGLEPWTFLSLAFNSRCVQTYWEATDGATVSYCRRQVAANRYLSRDSPSPAQCYKWKMPWWPTEVPHGCSDREVATSSQSSTNMAGSC